MRILILLALVFVVPGVCHAQVEEVCNNVLDDDGDNLADCDDPDCFFPSFADQQVVDNPDSASVEIGDLDGDGDLDAYLANVGPDQVWINQGNNQSGTLGTFVASNQSLGEEFSWGVKLGDLDGDGDLDAFVANGGPNRVWLNRSETQASIEIVFEDSGQSLGNFNSHDVALADFDNDGDLDAWVANSFEQPNRLWINQGGEQLGAEGVFVASSQNLGNASSNGVAVGDLDGDGDIDTWVANEGFNRVWVNQGGAQGGETGVFWFSGQLLGNSSSEGVSLADVDGDGDLDAWVSNSGPNHLWINQGESQGGAGIIFMRSGQSLGNGNSSEVAFEDFDADGDLDAWISNRNFQPNELWINQGGAQLGETGNFVNDGESYGLSRTRDSAIADLDGDGDPDIWAANGFGFGNDSTDHLWTNFQFCDNDLDDDSITNNCDIDQTMGEDCDNNGIIDSCQQDSDGDGLIDPCDEDIDNDGILNDCDIDHSSGNDCNHNGSIDLCDLAQGAEDVNGDGIPDECDATPFVRGDQNDDALLNLGDVVITLQYLFQSGDIQCEKSTDCNDDGRINLADVVYLLEHLYIGGTAPTAPFPFCGTDPTADALECEKYNGC